MNENLQVQNLFDRTQTIARDLFSEGTFPWNILPKINQFILDIGPTLSKEEYDKIEDNIWVAKSAKVAKSASINGPAIIGKNSEIRHCAFIRGNAIIGEGCVVGNSDRKSVV